MKFGQKHQSVSSVELNRRIWKIFP